MEGREGIGQGVTLIGGEAPPAYHVAARLDNPPQAVPPPPAADAASSTPMAAEKRKRGRPRKYAPDGAVNMALSPRPASSSAPRQAGEFSPGKLQGKSRALGSDYGYFPGDENTSGLGTCYDPVGYSCKDVYDYCEDDNEYCDSDCYDDDHDGDDYFGDDDYSSDNSLSGAEDDYDDDEAKHCDLLERIEEFIAKTNNMWREELKKERLL